MSPYLDLGHEQVATPGTLEPRPGSAGGAGVREEGAVCEGVSTFGTSQRQPRSRGVEGDGHEGFGWLGLRLGFSGGGGAAVTLLRVHSQASFLEEGLAAGATAQQFETWVVASEMSGQGGDASSVYGLAAPGSAGRGQGSGVEKQESRSRRQ